MKILLPIYATDDTKLIVDFVSNYRWPPHPEFKLLHVAGTCSDNICTVVSESDVEQLVEDVCERLLTVVPAAELSWQIVRGDTVEEIVALAKNWHADMIVMGYRKRKSTPETVIASVAKAVAKEAPCSVVIISPPKGNIAVETNVRDVEVAV